METELWEYFTETFDCTADTNEKKNSGKTEKQKCWRNNWGNVRMFKAAPSHISGGNYLS